MHNSYQKQIHLKVKQGLFQANGKCFLLQGIFKGEKEPPCCSAGSDTCSSNCISHSTACSAFPECRPCPPKAELCLHGVLLESSVVQCSQLNKVFILPILQ